MLSSTLAKASGQDKIWGEAQNPGPITHHLFRLLLCVFYMHMAV